MSDQSQSFGLYLSEHTMEEMGDKLGQNFTEGELSCVQDVLRDAARLLGHVAPDEHIDPDDTARTRAALETLADAIEQGEKRYRED